MARRAMLVVLIVLICAAPARPQATGRGFLRSGRRLRVNLVCPPVETDLLDGCRGRAVVRRGRARLGRARFALRSNRVRSITIALTRRVRRGDTLILTERQTNGRLRTTTVSL